MSVEQGVPSDWELGTIVGDGMMVDGSDISRRAMVVGYTAKRVRVQYLGTELTALAEPQLLYHGKIRALWLDGDYWTPIESSESEET